MYIVGNIRDRQIVRVSGTYAFGDPSDDKIVLTLGGVRDDYSILHISDNSEAALRLLNGDEFDPVWEDYALVGFDFSKEDSKPWIEFEFDKTEIVGDGLDFLSYSGRILKGGVVDTSINETVHIPVISPAEGPHTFPIEVVDGEASGEFATTDCGHWNIIYKPRVDRFKVKHRIELYVKKPEV